MATSTWGFYAPPAKNLSKYMRLSEINFIGNSLCPDRPANMFFDDVSVTDLCQRGNPLVLSNRSSTLTGAFDASRFRNGVGIINTTSGAYAEVIASSNNIVYLDQNYLTLKIGYEGVGSLSSTQFKEDDIVYQSYFSPKEAVVTGDLLLPATWPTYSSFLNRYGVWIVKLYGDEGEAVPGSEDWSEYTWTAAATGTIERSYQVIFPTLTGGQTYQYAFRCDNTGYFSIDGTTIQNLNTNVSTNWTSEPTYTTLSVTAGVHTVKWSGTNAGAAATNNPGAVGLHIKTSAGVTIFDSRYPVNVNGYNELISFQGRVQYYDSSSGILAILPETGVFNHTPNVSQSTLRKVNSSGPSMNCNVYSIVTGNQFPVGSTIRETANSSNVGLVSSFDHYSGVYAEASNSTVFVTQSNVSSTIVGNTIFFTYGSFNTSNGTTRTISSVSGNTITLNAALTNVTSNVRYSIGTHVVDDYGLICGIFNVPETENQKFPAGDKLFTITDTVTVSDNSYTMKGAAFYKASNPGVNSGPVPASVSATLPVVRTTKVRTLKGFDPLAQTFFVPGANTVSATGEISSAYGMSITSVDLFFAEKPGTSDEQLPVVLRIVDVDNDLPTGNVITECVVECRNVKVSTIPDMANTSTLTKFTFPHPVHLETNTNYAITLTTDSPYYNIHVAEKDKTILGTTRKVSTQPYVGNFFKAQNASTWSPILNTDLMFRINRCYYNPNSMGTVLFNPKNVFLSTIIDTFVLHTNELNQKATTTNYKFKANNVLGQDAGYQYIEVNTPYSFGSDLATSTKSSNRRRVLASGDSASMNVGVELITTDSTVSPIIYREQLGSIAIQNIINDGSLANTNLSVITGGRHANTENIAVTISAPDDVAGTQAYAYAQLVGSVSNTDIIFSNYGQHSNAQNISITFSSPSSPSGTKANGYVQSIHANGNVNVIIIDNEGSGYANLAPTITFGEPGTSVNAAAVIRSNVGSLILIGVGSGYYTSPTVTISEPSMTANATGIVNGETDANGGNCQARYITKRVDLAPGFDAGDLRVFLDCVRPRGTDINVYYKVKADSDTDAFDSKKWKLMYKVNDVYSIDQEQQVELEFKPNLLKNVLSYVEDGITYPLGGQFKSYAIKIVMTAADPTVVPVVTNFSAIATPEG